MTSPSRVTARAPRWEAWASGAGVGAIVSAVLWAYSARQWSLYRAPSWDLGIFTEAIRAYSEWRAPVVALKGDGYMLLGDHFHPLLALLGPIYALHPSGFTLLAAQAVLFGLGAGVVAGVATRTLGRWGIAIGLASGLSYLVVEAQASQFHEVALAVPLLAVSLGFLVRRRGVAAALWAVPLLGVKEDLGLTVMMVGLVVALRARSRGERACGFTTAIVGLVGFVAITQWVLPALNPDGVWAYASDSIVSLGLRDPGAALAQLGAGWDTKIWLVLGPVLVSGVISVRSPLALVALPTVAWRIASDVPLHWGTAFHYGAVLAPVMFLALVDALQSIRWRQGEAAARWEADSAAVAEPEAQPDAEAPASAGTEAPAGTPLAWLVPGLSAAVLVVALALVPRFSLGTLIRPVSEYQAQRAGLLREAEAQVRAALEASGGTRVESDITLMAYLAPSVDVYWIGNVNPVPDVVVVDRSSGVLHPAPEDIAQYASKLHPGTDFVTVWDSYPVGIAVPVPATPTS